MATWEEQSSAYLAGHQSGTPANYEHWLSNYRATNVGVHKHPVKIRYTYPPPGAGSGTLYDQAALYMDFTQNVGRLNGVWSSAASLLATTRASVAQMDSSSGFWGEFAANTPRISDKGLLIEEVRTNSIRNNTMAGAVAGTPGTRPTNWAAPTLAGLTQTIVGIGTQNGIDYIDFRFFGTTSATAIQVSFDTVGNIAAANGQAWTQSAFMALVGGSLANVTNVRLRSGQYDSGVVFLSALDTVIANPTATLTRYTGTVTTNNASTAFTQLAWVATVVNASAVDFTIRFGWPQLELGAFVTSPIKTSTVAVARAGDTVDVTTFVPTSPATLFSEIMQAQVQVGTNNGTWAIHATNGSTDRMSLTYNGATLVANAQCFVASALQADMLPAGAATVGVPSKLAAAFATNDFAAVRAGGTPVVDAAGTLPTPLVKLVVGRNTAGGGFFNGYIRRVAYWNTRLTNAQLQVIST